MSPELIDPQRFGLKSWRPTKSSDCYALGMVIYETISGNLPFHEDTDLTVFVRVLEGKYPPRGARFTNGLWRMLEQCWGFQPNHRPAIADVLRCLVFSRSESLSLTVDDEVEKDSDDWKSANSSSSGTSFDLSHFIDCLPSPVLISVPRIDFDNGGTHQVSTIQSYIHPRPPV